MPDRRISEVIAGRGFVAVTGGASVREVARQMQQHRTNAVMVVGRGQVLAGICSERDIVTGVVAAGLDPDRTPVSAVMTAQPQTLTADRPFCHALHLMYEGGFHHVPVVDSAGRPLGMLTARDALNIDICEFERELVQREDITVIL